MTIHKWKISFGQMATSFLYSQNRNIKQKPRKWLPTGSEQFLTHFFYFFKHFQRLGLDSTIFQHLSKNQLTNDNVSIFPPFLHTRNVIIFDTDDKTGKWNTNYDFNRWNCKIIHHVQKIWITHFLVILESDCILVHFRGNICSDLLMRK